MELRERINKRIAEIEADSRYISGQKHPAEVFINAPLALIQTSLETEIETLKWVLAGYVQVPDLPVLKFTDKEIMGLIPAQAIIDFDRAKEVIEKVATAQRDADKRRIGEG